MAAFEVAEILAAGGVEIAVEELEAVDLAVGTATGAEGLAFGVRGRAHDAGAERRRGRRGFGRKNEQSVGEMAQIAVERGVQDLEALGEFPGADVVAGFAERAGLLVRARGEDVQLEVGERVGAQLAHGIAFVADQRAALDEEPLRLF